MVLSYLDTNKYDAVIRFKESIVSGVGVMPSSKGCIPFEPRKTNEYGEVAVSRMIQEQKRLSDEEISLLIAAYKDGKSTYDLARQFGCHRLTVSAILKRHGVAVSKCRERKKLDTEEVIALYQNMHNAKQIADKYKVHPQVVIRLLRANGVRIRSRWG